MDQQTSNGLVRPGNEDAARAAVKQAFHAQAAIPEEFRNTAPFGTDTRLVNWFFDKLLPWLGFGSVTVDTFQHESKPYHRVTISIPFRTSRFVVNAFGAYNIGKSLLSLVLWCDKDVPSIMFQNFGNTGDVYVPGWAVHELAEDFGNVVKIHQARVQWSVDEVRRAQLPFLGTPDDNAEHESEQQAAKLTLH